MTEVTGLSAAPVELRVDGATVAAAPGATILEACDIAGRYVPRLCTYPSLHCCSCCFAGRAGSTAEDVETGGAAVSEGHPETSADDPAGAATACGLCAVRLGDEEVVLACATAAEAGMEIITDDEELRRLRIERLGRLMHSHPFVCLLCPDRDGCSRDECSYGNPAEARCCDRYGSCELAALLAFVDPEGELRPGPGPFDRQAVTEGPIRREPGLCVGCGRCVVVCEEMEGAGRALRMVSAAQGIAEVPAQPPVATPKGTTLRAAGCTFCGRCVLVCPTGAFTVSGDAGQRWLERRRLTSGLAEPILPPQRRLTLCEARAEIGSGPGVLQIFDVEGKVLLISGVADLGRGLEQAVSDLGADRTTHVLIESGPLYTQRESELLTLFVQRHGHLPPGNDLGDDLFDEDW